MTAQVWGIFPRDVWLLIAAQLSWSSARKITCLNSHFKKLAVAFLTPKKREASSVHFDRREHHTISTGDQRVLAFTFSYKTLDCYVVTHRAYADWTFHAYMRVYSGKKNVSQTSFVKEVKSCISCSGIGNCCLIMHPTKEILIGADTALHLISPDSLTEVCKLQRDYIPARHVLVSTAGSVITLSAEASQWQRHEISADKKSISIQATVSLSCIGPNKITDAAALSDDRVLIESSPPVTPSSAPPWRSPAYFILSAQKCELLFQCSCKVAEVPRFFQCCDVTFDDHIWSIVDGGILVHKVNFSTKALTREEAFEGKKLFEAPYFPRLLVFRPDGVVALVKRDINKIFFY